MFDLFGKKKIAMLERMLHDTRKENRSLHDLNDELFIKNMKLRSNLSKSNQNVVNANETAKEEKYDGKEN